MESDIQELPVATIRTSSRIGYRRCRRLWNWVDFLRENFQVKESALPLWIGTGFHYACEDFHGYRQWNTPMDAFVGFSDAYRKTKGLTRPPDYKDGIELAIGMLDYYMEWLKGRDPLTTYWVKGVPQVEVRFQVPLPIEISGYSAVIYDGTLDRVVIDEYGRLWMLDYKTCKQFELLHFLIDQQITSYNWAGSILYPKPIEGMIYQQHKKIVPKEPEPLQTGKLSCAENLQTTHLLYKKALKNLYSRVDRAPQKNIDYLNWLTTQENSDGDRFIRRDWIERNDAQRASEQLKILMETSEMLNPNIPIYPNPSRDCSWCAFQSPCISLDDGSDWELEISLLASKRVTQERDTWRQHLQPPKPPRKQPRRVQRKL